MGKTYVHSFNFVAWQNKHLLDFFNHHIFTWRQNSVDCLRGKSIMQKILILLVFPSKAIVESILKLLDVYYLQFWTCWMWQWSSWIINVCHTQLIRNVKYVVESNLLFLCSCIKFWSYNCDAGIVFSIWWMIFLQFLKLSLELQRKKWRRSQQCQATAAPEPRWAQKGYVVLII